MTRRRSRLLSVLAAIGLAFSGSLSLAVAAPAQAGVDDFTFESLDVQYYLDRDDAGHSTLRTVETFVALFPDFDQNRGLVRNIPITYGGTDAFDPRRVDTQLHIVSVTDENGDPVYWETYDAGTGIYGMYIDDDTYKHGRTTYVIEYTQQDVTRHFDDTGADEFYWDVNGTDWPQPFGTVSATVHLGDGLAGALNGDAACYCGEYGSDATCPIEVDGRHRLDQRDRHRQLPERVVRDRLRVGDVHARPDDGASTRSCASCPGCCSACSALLIVAIVILRRTRLGARARAAASSCRSTRARRTSA